MTDENTVWIAEAYLDGERIERIVHTTEDDAREDIEISTDHKDPDRIEVDECRLWLGQAEGFEVSR